MAKQSIQQFSTTPASNTDIAGINVNTGWPPSNVGIAYRTLMAFLADALVPLSLSVTSETAVTLSPAQASAMYAVYTGALTADCTITLPNALFVGNVQNATTGGHNIILTSGAGTTAVIAPGGAWYVYECDGAGNTEIASSTAQVSPAMLPVVSAATTFLGAAAMNVLPVVANIAALRANASSPPSALWVEGYASGADGGEGVFWYNSADVTSSDNGGTIIVDAANHRWYRETGGLPYSVKWFGATGNGGTDDTVALQAAINAVSAVGGGRVALPVGNYKYSSTLTIGNGSAVAASTIAGVVLVGEGQPSIEGIFSGYPVTSPTTLTWGGGAAQMILINGPIQGWGIQNIAMNGAGVSTIGINVISGQYGDNRNLLIEGCVQAGIGSATVPTFGSVSNTDSLHNVWRHVAIRMPTVVNVKGILLTGSPGSTTSDTDLNLFDDLFVVLPPSGVAYAIYLQNCDSNMFLNTHLAGGSASAYGIFFDYTASPGNIWPSANIFHGIEANGIVLGTHQFFNGGTPSINARPNQITGLYEDNSSTNPSIPNLLPDLPVVLPPNVFLDTQTASIAGTDITTPYEIGIYRISLYLCLQSLGNNVTVTASIGWNDGTAQTLSTAAVNFSTGANNPQTLTATIINVADLAFTYSTSVSGAVGLGTYRLAIVVERLS